MQHTLSLLKSSNANLRLSAIKELGSSASDPQVLKQLSQLLRDPNQTIRVETARQLGQVDAEARAQAVVLLADALANQDLLVRREAAVSLGKIGPEAKPVVPALVQVLKDADAKVRMGAAAALGQIGPAAAEAIPGLVTALSDCNLIYCRMAAQALSQIGAAAVPALTEALQHTDKNVRREAAWALGQIGPAAESAAPALTELLRGSGGMPVPPGRTPAGAADATAVINFQRTRPDETQILAPRAIPGLPDNDDKVRQTVAQALERIQGKK